VITGFLCIRSFFCGLKGKIIQTDVVQRFHPFDGKDEYNHFYKIYDSLPSRETDLNQKPKNLSSAIEKPERG
jgi:hypothetical protein